MMPRNIPAVGLLLVFTAASCARPVRSFVRSVAEGGWEEEEYVEEYEEAGETDEPRDTPLHEAAEAGDGGKVRELIAAGADVTARGKYGDTPLHEASWAGRGELVEALIAAGADLNARNESGETPLHHAAFTGHAEAVRALLAAGAEVNAEDRHGETPLYDAAELRSKTAAQVLIAAGAKYALHAAAMLGDAELAKALIAGGADVDELDPHYSTPVEYAAREGSEEIVSMLLAAGAKVNGARRRTALHEAAEKGHFEIVKALLAAGADVNARDGSERTPLYEAAAGGHAEIVGMLVEAGADVSAVDMWGGTPMRAAASRESRQIAAVLMAAGAKDALHGATVIGDVERVKALIEQGADVNAQWKDGRTPLHEAVAWEHAEIVAAFVEAGADVDAEEDEMHRTPLHVAACKEIVSILIAARAKVNARDKWGGTPLHVAAHRGDKELVAALIAAGALVDARSEWGDTPLLGATADSASGQVLFSHRFYPCGPSPQWRSSYEDHKEIARMLIAAEADHALYAASAIGDAETVKDLLARGADVNERAWYGLTPVHAAAAAGFNEVLAILAAAGADVDAESDAGARALGIAYQVGHKDTVALLIAAGADVPWTSREIRSDPAVRRWIRPREEMLKAAREELEASRR